MGLKEDEALSLGRCLAGLNAQAKGRRLGIFKPAAEGAAKARKAPRGEEFWVELCARSVPARNTADGIRAVTGPEPIDPAAARRPRHRRPTYVLYDMGADSLGGR